MNLWGIVPVKSLREGKSRLANVLTEEERITLNQSMMMNTLNVLMAVDEINEVVVVSRDDDALNIASNYCTRIVRENCEPELNPALTYATEFACNNGANAILILPADLPLLYHHIVKELLSYIGNPPEMVIAPDRWEIGTNGLILNPADNFTYHFGDNSFNLHIQQAKSNNYHIEVFHHPTLEFDLDVPDDLNIFKKLDKEIPS